MMSNNFNTEQKQVSFKAYKDLRQLENALKDLKEANTNLFHLSILGKVNQYCIDKDIMYSMDNSIIKLYWQDLMGKTVNFGSYYNPESGFVFIVGYLMTIFLHKINGKSLATLSSGSYGIFRGIGGSEAQATMSLKMLNSGCYLLILRGDKSELNFL
ncbi:hypothetical protein [uncultured Winogradskyella sp.]|uniref:hypothetical protein n=1 Tax=uncultured Winogradskyella sp. TaxID=395353 RepID=UPI002625B413|nr:hypothetical protein [uncultured Winogradskyella sp.]